MSPITQEKYTREIKTLEEREYKVWEKCERLRGSKDEISQREYESARNYHSYIMRSILYLHTMWIDQQLEEAR